MSKLRVERLLLKDGFKLTHGLGYYSSLLPGGVSSLYTKGGMEVIVGLGEVHHPPTLLRPVPVIKDGNSYRQMNQKEVIGWITDKSDKEIMDFIYKKSI